MTPSPAAVTLPLAFLALALGFAAAPVRAQQVADVDSKVRAIVDAQLQRPGAVGLSVGIAQRGEVLLERGYGRADAEFAVAADGETMFRIGSITKQFTAAAVLRCAGRGALAIDDPLTKYVTTFPLGDHEVTLRQLLTHTSGIPNYTDAGAAWTRTRALELSHAELLAVVAGKPFDFAPGQGWRYGNTGYYLLGMVLEQVTGKPYAQVVADELTTPLGLQRTRYDSNKALITNRAQGYAFADGALANDDPIGMSQPGAAGGLLSTGGDLVRWSMALAGGKVVSKEQFAAMTTATVLPNGRDTHYGFGIGIGEFEGRKVIRHGGGIDGFNSMLMWLPDADLHVAVISNGERLASGRVAEAIARAVLGIEHVAAKDLPLDAAAARALAGNYRLDDRGLGIAVTFADGVLKAQGDGQGAFRLLWQGEREYRAEFDDAVRVVFDADGKGFELHQGGGIVHARRLD